ncbi:MAG: threonine/serine exporter family protein [Candidatus Bruticola sp.]
MAIFSVADFFISWFGAVFGLVGCAVFFRIPIRAILGCTLAGLLGWQVYYLVSLWGVNPMYCGFLGTLTISLCSETLARALRMPSTVFVLPGIFPLVPGILTYNAMISIIRGQTSAALQDGLNAMLIASGIAVGILMGTALSKGIINPSLNSLHTSLQDDFDISLPELADTAASDNLTNASPSSSKHISKRSQHRQNRRNKYHKLKENHNI